MISEYNELRKDKIIRVEENKKKFIINNKDLLLINHVKVDGYLITTGNRCDHLFEIISLKSDDNGILSPEKLKEILTSDIAAMMLTVPNTLGVFEKQRI